MESGRYIFAPTATMWPAKMVNARLGKIGSEDAAAWLNRNRPVEQITWAPGLPVEIRDRLIVRGGWTPRRGARVFNQYRPPTIPLGDPRQAAPWIEHARRLYGDDAEHVLTWFAHRVQRPGDKINHALLLLGGQGVGKDTLIEGTIPAVGPWNVNEVSPHELFGRFNTFAKSVILRINEARDLGEADRYRLYEHLKTYTAAPPSVLTVDQKHVTPYPIPNVCGAVITSNHVDGMYVPPDDRRHFVALTGVAKEDFPEGYWQRLYSWYEAGGFEHVAAFLMARDLSKFNAKAPPPKTEGFHAVVDAGRNPLDGDLADALEEVGNPAAVTLSHLASSCRSTYPALSVFLTGHKTRRQVRPRLEAAGYTRVRNGDAKDGLWKVHGKRQGIYAKRELVPRERIRAAHDLVHRLRKARPAP